MVLCIWGRCRHLAWFYSYLPPCCTEGTDTRPQHLPTLPWAMSVCVRKKWSSGSPGLLPGALASPPPHTHSRICSPLSCSHLSLCLLCLHPPWDGGSLSPVPPPSHRDLWVGLLAWLAAQRTFRSWIHRTSLQLRSVSLAHTQFNSSWWWNREKKVPLALFCLRSSENQTAGNLKEHRTPRTWKAERGHDRLEASRQHCVSRRQSKIQRARTTLFSCTSVNQDLDRGLAIS